MDPAGAGRPRARTLFDGAPVLCGHRGSGRGVVEGHAENTLPSFLAAVDAGLDWVEVDTRLTADGALVARHDPTLPDGRLVAELTAVDAAEAGLPTVAQLLDELPDRIAVNIDVKTALEDALRPRAATTAARVGQLAAAHAGRRRLLVTSFDPAAVLVVREHAPGVAVGLIGWNRFPLRKAIPAAVHLGAEVVVGHVAAFGLRRPEGDDTTAAAHAVQLAHAARLEVGAWCPDERESEALAALGVDCLVVDDAPARARAALRA